MGTCLVASLVSNYLAFSFISNLASCYVKVCKSHVLNLVLILFDTFRSTNYLLKFYSTCKWAIEDWSLVFCYCFFPYQGSGNNINLMHSFTPSVQNLDRHGVCFCSRTTYDDNAITNAVDIYTTARYLYTNRLLKSS